MTTARSQIAGEERTRRLRGQRSDIAALLTFLTIARRHVEIRNMSGSRDAGLMPIAKEFLLSTTFKEFAENISTYLVPLFSAQGSLFSILKDGKLDPPNSIRSGLCEPAEAWTLYVQYFHKVDPIVIRPFTPFPFKVYTTDDVVKDENSYLKSEYYNGYLRRFSVRKNLVINLGSTERPTCSICIARRENRRPFDSSDKNLARMIEPFLTAAFEKVLLLHHNQQQESMIGSLLANVGTKGVVEFNEFYRPVRKNNTSDMFFSLLYKRDEPREGIPGRVLEGLRACMDETSSGHAASFSEKSPATGQRILISVTPTSSVERPHFIMRLEFDQVSFLASQQLKQYRLTEREIEIASHICEGTGNAEISDKLHISEHTVVNHIRHIYEKMGVNSRAGLLHRVLELTVNSC